MTRRVEASVRALAIFVATWAACTAALAQEPRDEPRAPAATHGEEPTADDEPQVAAGDRATPQQVTVTWQAPDVLRKLLQQFIPPPKPQPGQARGTAIRPWIREVRKRVPEIAAAEGYFSATVDIEFDGERRDHVTVTVTTGPRTTVRAIEIEFAGDLAGEGAAREKRRGQLRRGFGMKAGQPFVSSDWETAKTALREALTDVDYAAGELSETIARVDVEAASADLKVVLDSGPPFTLGDVEIVGLSNYPESVIRRAVNLVRGERYDLNRLTEIQRLIQTGPWFSSVLIEVARDRDHPDLVTVRLTVTEQPRREIGTAIGYGTDDGARAELAYRDRNLFDRGFDLQSSARVSQKRSIGYADVYLPPGLMPLPKIGDTPFKDSFGVLVEHNNIENINLKRFAVAGYRHFKLDKVETEVGLSYQIERTHPEGADENLKRALAPVIAFTWRHVDNIFDPRRGFTLNMQLAAGSKALASGDDFLKTYGQFQYWYPLGKDDQLLLRTEWGRTFAVSRDHIPEDFLFRAGGARSNRGYAYQSLGVTDGNAIVGGRYLATGSVEYVHWFNEKWGGAVFTDVGDASDSIKEWQPLKSYGIGARYRTPAGPFALDVAYADRDHKFRLAFSVTVAF